MTQAQRNKEEAFERFIEFGALLDRKTRKYLVQYLRSKFETKVEQPPALNQQYYQYFCEALDTIFESKSLTSLIETLPGLSDQLSTEVLQWVRNAYQQIQKQNPYQADFERLSALSVLPLKQFLVQKGAIFSYLGSTYDVHELASDFYLYKINQVLEEGSETLSPAQKEALEKLITDLLSQWDALLQARLLAYQLKKLAESQENFQEQLESKAEEYKKLMELLLPFANYTGKYWDMARGLWQEEHLQLLEEYKALLEEETELKRLTDMLGKLREAELIAEEETYETVISRQIWLEPQPLQEELIGVHTSNDLSHMISSEVSLLSEDATESIFLQKYADRKLLTFQYEAHESVISEDRFQESEQRIRQKEKGPFIVCVDTSDSMSGEAERIAKVLCFAILRMAAQEHRSAYLINFSVGVQTIDLHDIGQSLDQIVAFLKMSFHGGTDITLALYEVMRQLETQRYQDADVLIISDFIMYRLDEDLINKVKFHQERQATRFYSLILNPQANQEVLDHFDGNWLYDPEKKGLIRELANKMQVIKSRAT